MLLLGHCPFGLEVALIFKGTEASWEGSKTTFHPKPWGTKASLKIEITQPISLYNTVQYLFISACCYIENVHYQDVMYTNVLCYMFLYFRIKLLKPLDIIECRMPHNALTRLDVQSSQCILILSCHTPIQNLMFLL